MVHSVGERERQDQKSPSPPLLRPLLAVNMCGVGSTELVPDPAQVPQRAVSPGEGQVTGWWEQGLRWDFVWLGTAQGQWERREGNCPLWRPQCMWGSHLQRPGTVGGWAYRGRRCGISRMRTPLSLVSSPHLGRRGPRWGAGLGSLFSSCCPPVRTDGAQRLSLMYVGSAKPALGRPPCYISSSQTQNAVPAELNHVSRAALILQIEQDGAWGPLPLSQPSGLNYTNPTPRKQILINSNRRRTTIPVPMCLPYFSNFKRDVGKG